MATWSNSLLSENQQPTLDLNMYMDDMDEHKRFRVIIIASHFYHAETKRTTQIINTANISLADL